MRTIFFIGLTAAALALTGCGGGDSNAPTAEENAQLDNAAEMLDTSADSLTVENPTLGNGDAPVSTPVDANASAANSSDEAIGAPAANAAEPTNAQ
jgi:hypothetical protein